MKSRLFSIFLTLFLISTFYLPNTFAQNPTRWSLPESAIARFGKGPATKTLTFSPDGTQFAIGWKTGIWIYDTQTYQEVALFTMDETVRAFAFSPDGKTLAGSNRNETRLWDVATGQHKQTLNSGTSRITFSPDGRTLSIGRTLWDASTGGYLKRPPGGFAGGSECSDFSPNGRTLVGCFNTDFFLWDTSTDQLLWFKGHLGWVGSVVFSPDGQTIASGSEDNTIRLWDATTGQLKNILTDHRDNVNSIAFTPDGSTLLSGSSDKTIRVWDVATGLQKEMLTGHSTSIYGIALSPDGNTLMSGSIDNAIYFWDLATGERLKILRESAAGVDDIAFSPDNTIIATELGKNIVLWDIATGLQKQVLTGHTDGINSIVFRPDGNTLVSGSIDNTVRVWDVTTGQIQKILTVESHWDIERVVFSPDGGTLAGDNGAQIFLWDAATGLRKQRLAGNNNSSIAFSPDGGMLASGSRNTTIHLWDVVTGVQKQTFTGHGGSVDSVAFSSDGSILASGSSDTTIRLWNVATGQHLKTLVGHTKTISSLSFSSGGKILTSGSPDGTLRFWDALTGEHLETQETPIPSKHRNDIVGVALSPDGGTLASGSRDGIVFLWGVTPLSVAVEPLTQLSTQIAEDVNTDGVVNIQDLVLIASNFGETGKNVADVNDDGVVNIEDLVKVAGALINAAGAPSVWERDLEVALTHAEIHQWLQEARQINLTNPDFQRGVLMLEQLLAMLTPQETILFPNYPNPFNPETWIPYQLATPADVHISIYTADGKLVRTLDLGHQPIGIYQDKSRAAHWDGRNELGEPVASSVYFYTLSTESTRDSVTAGDFTATRKMLILK